MITSQQLIEGSEALTKAAEAKYEEASFCLIPFNRDMYLEAASKLGEHAYRLKMWSGVMAAYEAGDRSCSKSYVELIDRNATSILKQMEPMEAVDGGHGICVAQSTKVM